MSANFSPLNFPNRDRRIFQLKVEIHTRHRETYNLPRLSGYCYDQFTYRDTVDATVSNFNGQKRDL